MTAAGGSVAIGIRLENWSSYTLTQVGHIYIHSHRLLTIYFERILTISHHPA